MTIFIGQIFPTISQEKFLALWRDFYFAVFSLRLGENEFQSKYFKLEEDFPILVEHQLSLIKIWEKCRDSFPCYLYEGLFEGSLLDETIHENSQRPIHLYLAVVSSNLEADFQFERTRIGELKTLGINFINFRERLLFELYYFWLRQKLVAELSPTVEGELELDGEATKTFCLGTVTRTNLVPTVCRAPIGLSVSVARLDQLKGSPITTRKVKRFVEFS